MNVMTTFSDKRNEVANHFLDVGTPFIKYHSLGNDFIIIDLIDGYQGELPSLIDSQGLEKRIERMCNRFQGIGANGLLIITKSAEKNTAYATIFNQDGSPGSLCLNGARCITHYLVHQKKFSPEVTLIMGGYHLKNFYDKETFLITTQVPFDSFERPEIVAITPLTYGYRVNLANPHLVIFQSITEENLILFAKNLKTNKSFENGINIEYVWQTPAQHKSTSYTMRIYERGVGITQACSSGACAVLYTLNHLEHIQEQTLVYFDMPGGTLQASLDSTTQTIKLTADAHPLFAGVILA